MKRIGRRGGAPRWPVYATMLGVSAIACEIASPGPPDMALAAAPETATVTLVQPQADDTVSGVVTVRATATGARWVEFRIDDDEIGRDSVAPYEAAWDTRRVEDRWHHEVEVRARGDRGRRATIAVVVFVQQSVAPEPPPPDTVVTPPASDTVIAPPPPPPPAECVVQDTVIKGNLVIPAGQRCLIGRNVQVAGNVLVQDAVLAMRPGSSLRFLGADPNAYVGGGLNFASGAFQNDIGLWVWGSGELDIACTPKVGWNRTGSDPSWSSTDELWIAPTAPGDFAPRRWFPGDPIPQADARVPAAEVVNVTRDCSITGPGHVHVNSSRPQRVEYVRLEQLGISQGFREDVATTGRYALHLHMSGDGARGTVVRGVAAVNSRGRVFVPHSSHGVTLIDNVSVNSWGDAFWWDLGEETHDVLVDRLAVLGVGMSWGVAARTHYHDGVVLGFGNRMEIRNSVVAGVRDTDLSNGFDWPEAPILTPYEPNPAWTFNLGNVAHNNTGSGLRFWNNNDHDHVVENFVSYHNAAQGIENGAYVNANRYRNVLSYRDGFGGWFADFFRPAVGWGTNSNSSRVEGAAAGIAGATIVAASGAALVIGSPPLPGSRYIEFTDLDLTPAAGHPKVLVIVNSDTEHAWPKLVHFRRVNITPDDIVFSERPAEGSHLIIELADGSGWEIRVQNGQKVVTAR